MPQRRRKPGSVTATTHSGQLAKFVALNTLVAVSGGTTGASAWEYVKEGLCSESHDTR